MAQFIYPIRQNSKIKNVLGLFDKCKKCLQQSSHQDEVHTAKPANQAEKRRLISSQRSLHWLKRHLLKELRLEILSLSESPLLQVWIELVYGSGRASD